MITWLFESVLPYTGLSQFLLCWKKMILKKAGFWPMFLPKSWTNTAENCFWKTKKLQNSSANETKHIDIYQWLFFGDMNLMQDRAGIFKRWHWFITSCWWKIIMTNDTVQMAFSNINDACHGHPTLIIMNCSRVNFWQHWLNGLSADTISSFHMFW